MIADLSGMSSMVAAAFNDTPAHATRVSSSMSPEQTSSPEPPAFGPYCVGLSADVLSGKACTLAFR
jgi:hypothetical protein